MKKRRKFTERIIACVLAALMVVGAVPVDYIGSSVVAKGADYTNADKKVGTLTVSDWEANVRTSDWDFTSNIDTTNHLYFETGDTANGIVVTKGVKPYIIKGGTGLSIKPGDKLSIPVSSDTTSAVLEVTVSSTNSNRYVVAGEKKAYMNASNSSYDSSVDILFSSSKVATYTLDEGAIDGMGTSNACIKLYSGTTGATDSGEAKITKITLTETRTAGQAVALKVSYNASEIFSLAGSLSDEGDFSVSATITAGTSKLQFSEEPTAGNFSIVKESTDEVSDSAYKCLLDTANKKVIVYNDANSNNAVDDKELLKEIEYIVVGAATVSGMTSSAVSGAELKFTDVADSGNTKTATIGSDGSYSVSLNTGCKYDVELNNASGYRLDGDTGSQSKKGIMSLDLLLTSAGENVTNQNYPVIYYDAAKSGKVVVGDTTFVVNVPSVEDGVYDVSVESGTGNVEIAGTTKAVVWANLGGQALSSKVTAGDGVGAIDVDDNKITLKYSDQTSNPKSYVLEVRDNSLAKEPKKDGVVYSYSLTDGKYFSDLYTNSNKLTKSLSTPDSYVTLKGTVLSGIYFNDSTHGYAFNDGNSIDVKVAGNATITFTGSSFNASSSITATGDGTIYLADDESKTNKVFSMANKNPGTATFKYEGDATTLTFEIGGGTTYIRAIDICNDAPVGERNPDYTAIAEPEWIQLGSGNTLNVTESGQQLKIEQVSGGSNPANCSMLVFPEVKTNNKITFDIEVSGSGYILGGVAKADSASSVGYYFSTIRARKTDVQTANTKNGSAINTSGHLTGGFEAGTKLSYTVERVAADQIKFIVKAGDKEYSYTEKYSSSSPQYTANASTYDDALRFGILFNNVMATVTNMKYYDAAGNLLYDQNKYYLPLGTAPVVTGVTATAAEDRTKIVLSWTAGDAEYDANYVIQVKKPGSSVWEDVDKDSFIQSKTFDYMVDSNASGDYQFRVFGTLGRDVDQKSANKTAVVESNVANIIAALPKPVVTLPYTSPANQVSLTWTPSAGATRYEVYRRSSDEEDMTKIADVTTTSYVDKTVQAEVPYYYYVKGFSSTNFGNFSDEVWTLPTNGHSGEYDENVALELTKRSFNTVFENKITLEGVAGAAGTVSVAVNGVTQQTATVASANGTFSFDNNITLAQGRNDVVLTLEYAGGKIRKSLNYVYLTKYDIVVDAEYSGTAGTPDVNGAPQYKTITEAVAVAGGSKVILVRNGDYNERLIIDKANVSIIGEDSVKTRIYYDTSIDGHIGDNVGPDGNKGTEWRCAMYVKSSATGFTAENITIENSYQYTGTGYNGSSNESAEALRCDAPGAQIVGVRLLGYQDTLLANKSSQYYYKCYIAGNVDYMWGQDVTIYFNDCDFVFRYNSVKNSGYYTAFGNSPDSSAFVLFNNSRFYSEGSCGGQKYYLGRPYKANSSLTFVNCYMGSVLNKEWGYATWGGAELSSDKEAYEGAKYYESGTYGAGYDVNLNRRQISASKAQSMVATASGLINDISANYKGNMVLPANTGFVTSTYTTDKYSQYEGDDTGLAKYNLEGFAASSSTTGGGLLKENNANYYKVSTASEFLNALKKIRATKGTPSVIEVTSDLNLGYNEAGGEAFGDTNIIAPHNPALLSPVLKASGVSKIYIKGISNLTIFSKNGASIKHAALDISDSKNIIIRNLQFDELWEWDEKTAGDYDENDWDYMTIENGSSRVWVDHCTFYKSYDGVVDIKTTGQYATGMDITVSWCKFMPGSKGNVFFNAMMNMMKSNPDAYPYYNSLLKSGMSDEQIRIYAYGQKKTHLLGQNDEATANENLHVTFANNYYYDSMDRMPRVRFGTSHMYNCVMDAQELFDARMSITNKEAAKHIVSNGASSTCDAKVLLENCYLNGIINALNSGNGSSPSGYINAINSLYYINGTRYKLEPKVNNSLEASDRTLKITDASSFKSSLGYSYVLRDAATLSSTVVPYTGAGNVNMSVLQWEKSSYIDAVEAGSDVTYTNDGLPTSNFTDELGNESNPSNPSSPGSDDTDSDSSDDDYDSSDDSSDTDSSNTSSTEGYDVLKPEEIPGATVTQIDGTNFAEIGEISAGAEKVIAAINAEGKITTDAPVMETTENVTSTVVNKLYNDASSIVTTFAKENTSITKEVFDKLKETGKTLSIGVVDKDGKVNSIVTIDGSQLTGKSVNFNLKITVDAKDNKVERVADRAGIKDSSYTIVDFEYSGNLPGTLKAAVNVSGKFNDGTRVALYYYNSKKGVLENQYQVTTVSNGFAEFAIDHCSEYVLVDVSAAEGTITTSTLGSPKTADSNAIVFWLMLMCVAVLVLFGIQASKTNDKKKA